MAKDLGVVGARLSEIWREQTERRIREFMEDFGPPATELTVPDETDQFRITYGYWKIEGGVLRVEKLKNGTYDPVKSIVFHDKEAEIIAGVSRGGNPLGSKNGPDDVGPAGG